MPAAGHPGLLRWTPQLMVLSVVAAGLWVLTLTRTAGMGSMSGTMGLSVGAFTGAWALMMGAMMLPSVAPVALLYSRTFQRRRIVRLVAFTSTYLAVWALSAIPAWAILGAVEAQVGSGRSGTAVASFVFATVGVWQLSPFKQRCLRHCRSPISQFMHYASFAGPFREVRVALRHAAYCLGCCWALMALFIVTGTMHLVAMVALAAVVAAEKLLPRGEQLALSTGVLSLLAAVAVWWLPGIAPGLT